MKGIASALVKALATIEGVTKDKVNPHFKSKYADLSSVLETVRPLFATHDLAVLQETSPSEDGVIVETVVLHSSGEERRFGKLYLPANKRDAQGFGSALTYAKRYSLLTALGIPTEDDDGNAAAKSVANDGGLKRQLQESVKQADAPFPQGPAKNKTALKEMGREFWRDVESCEDDSQLDALIASNSALVKQIKAGLPTWWDGGTQASGEPFEGLAEVIERRRTEFANEAWKRNPVAAG